MHKEWESNAFLSALVLKKTAAILSGIPRNETAFAHNDRAPPTLHVWDGYFHDDPGPR